MPIETAQIWHCNFLTLAPLGELTNLRQLEIATDADDSLRLLVPLRRRVRVSRYPKAEVAKLRAAGLQDGDGTVVIRKQPRSSPASD